MGTVNPGIDGRFALLRAALARGGDVEFQARASGRGPLVQTEPVHLRLGDVVDFEIEINLVGSRATVRP